MSLQTKINFREKALTQNQGLNYIYKKFHEEIKSKLVDGVSLEIGSGSSNYKEFDRNIITSDIIYDKRLDFVFDALRIPFKDSSISNLILFDVLHHIEKPLDFLSEADRVLRTNGRIILVEPYVSPFSWLIYKLFHDEDTSFRFDLESPFSKQAEKKQPFDGNQAIPSSIFFRKKEIIRNKFPFFKVINCEKRSLFSYPLTFGLKSKGFFPLSFTQFIYKIGAPFGPLLGSLFAFRMFVVVEKI